MDEKLKDAIPVLRHSIKYKSKYLMEENGVRVTEVPTEVAQNILDHLEREQYEDLQREQDVKAVNDLREELARQGGKTTKEEEMRSTSE